ncbi:hypothetical protein QTP81_17005 [Alteromonas sp. ASW11-36]|uniref:DUF304 domain-containing protein n=1 Tax=Alteromonas arenosi TaxID=3055817 RepID=A0ABT7T255_9ALTE|nr:hypothetical protein [Alteromonas sp. ASW11-36]MDM7862309.1 hypothetical protein [Alteromonas sp. ASW11-36]
MQEPMNIGLPDKIQLEKHLNYIHITRKWFGIQFVFFTAFAVFWNAFLFYFYAGMDEDTDNFTRFLPILHVIAGIAISYYAIAGWVNKSHIFVSKQMLEIQHKPLPWIGNKQFRATDLKQLYAKEKISNNRNGTHVTYEVHAILTNGKNAKLLGGLDSSEQALYIEQEIEKYLGIKDTAVRGALG